MKKRAKEKKNKKGRAGLFISYSHTERAQMLVFRKHLEGLLYRTGAVWSDESIPRGQRWETRLRGELKNANAALVLITPDYLASAWCRRELDLIGSEQKAGRLKKVFWIQVEPSCWQRTDLALFQTWDFNLAQAVTAITDNNARTEAILLMCREIGSEMDELSSHLDPDLAFVREILVDAAVEHGGLVVDEPLKDGKGDFATVCRGSRSGENVAIKVVRSAHFKQMATAFGEMVEARRSLSNQCFIRVLDHFSVSAAHDEFTIVVEEFMKDDVIRLHGLLEDEPKRKKLLTVDGVATLVRRAAEALQQFHECRELAGTTYGLLTPLHVSYDPRGQKLLLPAVGVSNFLWDAMGWERFAAWRQEVPNLATYVAPEVAEGQAATAKTDQYMLGQLAFEMLEGKLPFDIRRPSDVQKKEDFWNNPERGTGEWVEANNALSRIIFRMLRRNPAERWESFDELRRRLLNLEDENRALAKRTFEGIDGFRLAGNTAFFKAFYDEFIQRSGVSPDRFRSFKDQPQKLLDSMVAVLNYRAGNEPTSLRDIVHRHQNLAISPKEVDQFRDAFLKTLGKQLPRKIPAPRRKKIVDAWRDLFSPVVEYFKDALQAGGRPQPAASAPLKRSR